jgi:hypothetical protein
MKAGAVSDHYGGSAGLRCCCLGVANLGSWSKMVAIGQRTATLSNVRFRELRQPLGGMGTPRPPWERLGLAETGTAASAIPGRWRIIP